MPTQRCLSQRSLYRLKRQLMDRRRVAAEMVESFSSEAREAHLTADNSDRLDSESPVGTASDESFSLAANALVRVAEIDRALSRLASGVYGYCQECGEMIPYRRLRAVPATTMCFECRDRTHLPNMPRGAEKEGAQA